MSPGWNWCRCLSSVGVRYTALMGDTSGFRCLERTALHQGLLYFRWSGYSVVLEGINALSMCVEGKVLNTYKVCFKAALLFIFTTSFWLITSFSPYLNLLLKEGFVCCGDCKALLGHIFSVFCFYFIYMKPIWNMLKHTSIQAAYRSKEDMKTDGVLLISC